MASMSGVFLYFKCPYHAKVMKMLEMTRRMMVVIKNNNGEAGIRTRGTAYAVQLLSRQLRSTTPPPLQNLQSKFWRSLARQSRRRRIGEAGSPLLKFYFSRIIDSLCFINDF